MSTAIEDVALMKLRIELYGAAQLLKGDALEELKKLIREIYMVLDLDGGPKTLTDLVTP